MKHLKFLLFTFAILFSTFSNASIINIETNQDVSLFKFYPDTNKNDHWQHLLVGDLGTFFQDYQIMFGFDMTNLTGQLSANDVLTINNMTFNAYNSTNNGSGNIDISLGNTDNWDDDVVTWNSSSNDHGVTIDSQFVDGSSLNNWVSWDISSVTSDSFMSDNYLTFYLSNPNAGNGSTNWHGFEAEEYIHSNNASYLSIDYTITSASVPEPSILLLFSIGFAGLTLTRRNS
jgi:hypothetical protein